VQSKKQYDKKVKTLISVFVSTRSFMSQDLAKAWTMEYLLKSPNAFVILVTVFIADFTNAIKLAFYGEPKSLNSFKFVVIYRRFCK